MSTEKKSMADCPEMDYFMNEKLSDVWFVIDGQRLPADKHFLSIRSKVFRAMFSNNEDKEVVIEDTTFDAFKTFIQFLYSDQLVLKDDLKLIEEIFKLTERYEMKRLMDRIADQLQTLDVNKDNIEFMTKIANSSQNEELNENVFTFIVNDLDNNSGEEFNRLTDLNDSTHKHLMKALFNNYIEVKEELKVVSTNLSNARKEQGKKYPIDVHLKGFYSFVVITLFTYFSLRYVFEKYN